MQHDHEGSDVESEAFVVVTFEGGTTGVCDVSGLAAIPKPRFYVRGTKATFRKYGIDPQEAAMKAGDIDSAVEDPKSHGVLFDGVSERTEPTTPGRWRNYYENIAAVLNEEAEPLVKLAEVRREIAVIDAARQSAESGEVVKTEIPALC
jgi:scyllo-inositol 2-dehydrogenase (NADP+)